MFRIALLAALALALPALAQAQRWGPKGCPPVGGFAPGQAFAPRYEWRQHENLPDNSYLYRDGKLAGGYRWSTGNYFAWEGDDWVLAAPPFERPARAPEQAPAPKPDAGPAVEDYGVDVSKLNADGPVYWHGEERISRGQALDLVTNGIPDDAHKLRLTVIGPDAQRQQVLADYGADPEMAALRERCLVWSVPADHWSVTKAGFFTSGAPTVYLQAPDGKVLHRQDDYKGKEDFQAIRKAVADYDPKKDPDRRKSDTLALGDLPPAAWAFGGVAALLLVLAVAKGSNRP